MTESVKTKKSCVSWKIFGMEFKFPKFSSIRSKALCLGVYKPIKRLAAQSTAHVLRNRQDKQALLKENKKEFLCFPVILQKFMNTFFTEHLWWLRLVNLDPSPWNQQYFSSSYTSYHGLPLHYDKIVVKRGVHRKIFVVVCIHIAIQTWKHLNKSNSCSDMYLTQL